MTFTELVELLMKADHAYYDLNDPIMSDADYEVLAFKTYPSFTGLRWYGKPTEGDIPHAGRLMGTQQKIYSAAELHKVLGEHVLVGTPKMDGLGLELTYSPDTTKPGMWLKQGLSRGRRSGGISYGENVTGTARKIPDIPGLLCTDPQLAEDCWDTEPRTVRGEIYLRAIYLDEVNAMRVADGEKPFKNARNGAAGIFSKGDPRYVQYLSFVAYQVFDPRVPHHEDLEFAEYTEQLTWLQRRGFATPPWVLIPALGIDHGGLKTWLNDQSLPYETDGVVFAIQDMSVQRSLGYGREHAHFSAAYKFEDQRKTTILRRLRAVATRTGRISLTGEFDPIELEGATIENATLHNLANVIELGIQPGDEITVFRSGMIIPQVEPPFVFNGERNLDAHLPSACPACAGPVTRNHVDLLCGNGDCPAKLAKAIHNAFNKKNWDVDGIGLALCEALVEQEVVSSLADLFNMTNGPETVEFLAGLQLGSKRLGAATAKKLVAGIEACKTKPWAITLHALGCPGLGEPQCQAIAERWGLKELLVDASLISGSSEKFQALVAIPGIGEKTANDFLSWLETNFSWLNELIESDLRVEAEAAAGPSSTALEGKTFVFTGALSKPRDVFEAMAKDAGATVSGSISKKTSFVVAGPGAGSKLEKAQSLGVAVLSEAEFLELL